MKIIFLHIPKSGGITFDSVLRRQYQNVYNMPVSNDKIDLERFSELPEFEREGIDVLRGHFKFGVHRYFKPNQEIKYITLLRNPVDRVISNYYYILSQPKHYLYKEVTNKRLSLKEYALSNIARDLDNGQLRQLISREVEINSCRDELLDEAMNNLRTSFASFGILERYDETLLLFKTKLGWRNYPFYKKLNETDKPAIKTEDRIAIERRNMLDMKLYQWALNEFTKELAMIDDYEKELSSMVEFNKCFNLGYKDGYEKGYNAGCDYFNNRFPLLKKMRFVALKSSNIFSRKTASQHP
jgi:hypothetical protein